MKVTYYHSDGDKWLSYLLLIFKVYWKTVIINETYNKHVTLTHYHKDYEFLPLRFNITNYWTSSLKEMDVGMLHSSSSSRVGAEPVPCSPDAPRPYERALCAPLLVSPVISRGAPRPAMWDTSISEGRKYGQEMANPILPTACDLHGVGIFYMPQIYDVVQTALLPLRRKACWGYFCPKNPTASAGFEPANLGTRGQHANH
jgi:hypothetical protein